MQANTDLSGVNAVNNSIVLGNGGSITVAGANNLEISGNLYNAGGNRSVTVNNTGSTKFSGGVYLSDSTSTGRTLTFSGTGMETISGVIANYGSGAVNTGAGTAGGVTRSGTGTLILSATNSYTGATTINSSGGTLQLGDGSTRNGAVDTSTGISVGSSSTLAIANPNSQTIAPIISGAGAVVKSATGVLSFTNANTYTGGTTINAGVINAGIAQNGTTSGSLGASGAIIFGGGTLQFSLSSSAWDPSSRYSTAASQAISLDVNGQTITNATGLTSSSGTLTLSDSAGLGKLKLTAAGNTYSGATVLKSGTLALGASATIPNTSSITVSNGATLDVSAVFRIHPWRQSDFVWQRHCQWLGQHHLRDQDLCRSGCRRRLCHQRLQQQSHFRQRCSGLS